MLPITSLFRRCLGDQQHQQQGTQGALAADIRVVTSGAFTEAYKKLVPLFEAATGHRVISSYGASIGNAPDSIPSRFARGEAFDMVILSEGGLEALMKDGKLVTMMQRHDIEGQDPANIAKVLTAAFEQHC